MWIVTALKQLAWHYIAADLHQSHVNVLLPSMEGATQKYVHVHDI